MKQDEEEKYADVALDDTDLGVDSEDEELEVTEEEDDGYIKMDFSLETPEERNELVKKIIENTPPERLTPKYLEKMADYIIFAMDKQEKKEKKILTDNHMITVNKRETSFEGLASKLENGEDGIYSMMTDWNKNVIFTPKISITEQDLKDIPELRELKEVIARLEESVKKATGKNAFKLKQMLIEKRQEQYIIKNAFKPPIRFTHLTKSFSQIDLSENIYIDAAGEVRSTGLVSLLDEKHVCALLCNYSRLKQDTMFDFNSDAKWLMMDLDNLTDDALLEKYPLYYDLMVYKIDGKSNLEIQDLLFEKYGVKHSVEYISSLWRNKIPKLIAEEAVNQWLIYHYTFEERGVWKKCSRCGQIKLAHNHFFSKNKTSKDGYYSICKACRNKKK